MELPICVCRSRGEGLTPALAAEKHQQQASSTVTGSDNMAEAMAIEGPAATRENGASENEPMAVDSKGKGKATKRFEIKKWNAVAMWSWAICTDTCAICRNNLYEPSIEYQVCQKPCIRAVNCCSLHTLQLASYTENLAGLRRTQLEMLTTLDSVLPGESVAMSFTWTASSDGMLPDLTLQPSAQMMAKSVRVCSC